MKRTFPSCNLNSMTTWQRGQGPIPVHGALSHPALLRRRTGSPTPPTTSPASSVVELSGNELAGEALLWGIDSHNRTAHLGISLRPAFRGRGLGTDVVRVLCTYGFAVRGLQRLQVETLADNAAMIRAAMQVGFAREGILRRSAWVNRDFADEVILGLLASEWDAN